MGENLKHLSDENFQETISNGVTLVDFYADWCGPCRQIAPIVEELANEMHEKATIAKLDIENAQQSAQDFGVTSIPTIIIFKDGKEVERIVGLRDKASLASAVESAL